MLVKITRTRIHVLIFCLVSYTCGFLNSVQPAKAVSAPQHGSQSSSKPARSSTASAPRPGLHMPGRTGAALQQPVRPQQNSATQRAALQQRQAQLRQLAQQRRAAQARQAEQQRQAVQRQIEIAQQTERIRRAQQLQAFEQRQQFIQSGRASAIAARTYERQGDRQLALNQYLEANRSLQQAKDQIGNRFEPQTDLALARSHLDAARQLALLGRGAEAREHIQKARASLISIVFQPMDPDWAYRASYLLADADLFECDTTGAKNYYRKAASLKPDFVPATSMAQYLNDAATTPNLSNNCAPLVSYLAANPDSPALAPLVDPGRTPVVAENTPPVRALNDAPSATTGTGPAPTTIAKLAISPPQLIRTPDPPRQPANAKKPSGPRIVQEAAEALGLVAALFEVTELGALAMGITLIGMIAEDNLPK